jgi:hypothetical protein
MKDLYLRKTIKIMKGQLTLETIIMLVVLLVLAGVMITLILTTFKPPKSPEERLSRTQFLQKCESLCREKNFGEYCRTYWKGHDWDENGKGNEVIKVGDEGWLTCEDRVYCFLVSPCEDIGYRSYRIEGCAEYLFHFENDRWRDPEKAKEKVLEEVSFSSDCSYPKFLGEVTRQKDIDWYGKYFKKRVNELASQSAGTTGTTPTTGLSFQDCKIDTSAKKVECSSNCQDADLLVITGKNKKGEDINIQGSPTISQGKISLTDSKLADVDCSQEINVVLVCKNPDDSKTASGSCTTS